MKNSLYIVMPAYNEEENIEAVVRSWYPLLEGKKEDSRLVIADSGSSDHTHEILLKLKEEMPQIEIISDTGRYHGDKVWALYDYAIRMKADYIFQTDSDGQTDPAEFPAFWKNRVRYDVILGNRKVRGDGAARAFVEKVVCLLLRLFFGVRLPDANAPFRLMKTEVAAKYLYKLPSDFNIPNIMMSTYFVYYKEKTAFKTIRFENRKAGKNSINIRKIIQIGMKALKDFYELRKEM